jgi:hypothetical protein
MECVAGGEGRKTPEDTIIEVEGAGPLGPHLSMRRGVYEKAIFVWAVSGFEAGYGDDSRWYGAWHGRAE